MKLIADGGSTKTDWRFTVDEKLIHSVQTGGINPFHLSESEIDEVLTGIDTPGETQKLSSIYFYGAGVAGERAVNIVHSALARRFGSETEISVGDDMLAAARALFKDREGIACILGTGSNSGLYKNGIIEAKIPALGYVLGDEGSGTDLGKRFINGLFKKAYPEELSREIMEKHKLDMHDVLQKVYTNELPAKHLASYSNIIKDYIEHEAIQAIVEDALNDFFKKNICRYPDFTRHEIGFVGSIAYHYNEILTRIAKDHGFGSLKILISPIDELVLYHK